jgi:hypothetical protein
MLEESSLQRSVVAIAPILYLVKHVAREPSAVHTGS